MSHHDLTDEKLMDIVSPFGNVISAKVSPGVCPTFPSLVLLPIPSFIIPQADRHRQSVRKHIFPAGQNMQILAGQNVWWEEIEQITSRGTFQKCFYI